MNTTSSSFVLSLWKQVVKTLSSSTSLQIGNWYSRQKDLVQSAQVRRCLGGVVGSSALGKRRLRGLWEDGGSLAGVFGVLFDGPSRGMMVLLVLQVHLQKDVGAG